MAAPDAGGAVAALSPLQAAPADKACCPDTAATRGVAENALPRKRLGDCSPGAVALSEPADRRPGCK